MQRICEVSCILLGVALIGLHLAGASGIQEDIAVVRICNATDPVDLGVFNAYMMHHDFESLDSHSRELSCFLLCIYTEFKWMDRHGNFRINKIQSWLRRAHLTLDDRSVLLHKCITIAELTDPCSRARHFTECFWSNHQENQWIQSEFRELKVNLENSSNARFTENPQTDEVIYRASTSFSVDTRYRGFKGCPVDTRCRGFRSWCE